MTDIFPTLAASFMVLKGPEAVRAAPDRQELWEDAKEHAELLEHDASSSLSTVE